MKDKAKYYYGALFSGLNIAPCQYNEWKKWYLSTHDVEETNKELLAEAYACAVYLWTLYSK